MLHVDIETRSRVDIGNGLDLYVHCPDIEILVVAWAFGDGPVQTWDIHDGDRPAELIAALRDPTVKKLAWNARFEQALFARCWDVHVPDEAWIDPMVVVLTLGLPGSLKDAGVALGLPAESLKNTDGSRLIRKFCVPREPTAKKPHEWSTRETDPTDWVRFRHYCEQDVIAERSIWHIVAPYDLDPGEWALWALDHRINARGLAIDLDLVRGAIALDEREKARSLADLNTLTGLPNGGSVTQLLPWLRDRGYRHGGLDKATVARALSEPDLADTVREALRLRSEISRTSVAKYASIMNWCGPDGRLRNVLQFAGAGRTGRWAGRGPQFQNLPRPARTVSSEEDMAFAAQCVRERDAATLEAVYGSVPDVLSSLVRAAIVASAGKKLVVCDFSSIEVAVIAWLTGSEPLLDVFRRGQDPYKVFAAGFYRKPYDQVTKAERSFSKPAVLGCFAEDTEVLTDRGWVPITTVCHSDRVWDGVAFVAHGGLAYRGYKRVVDWMGVRVTPDHRVMWREDQWLPVEEFCGSLRRHLSALALGYSKLPDMSSVVVEVARTTFVVATAAAKRGRHVAMSIGAQLARAMCALRLDPQQPTRATAGSCRTNTCESGGLTDTPPCSRDAQTQLVRSTQTTVGAASGSTMPGSTDIGFCRTYNAWTVGTTRIWNWIALTTTVLMHRAMCAWRRAKNKRKTPESATEFRTEAACGRLRNFIDALLRSIAARAQWLAKSDQGKRPSKSSRNSGAPVGRVATFDLVNCGPRHRFTIRTAWGPAIVHNCGFRLGPGEAKPDGVKVGLLGYADAMGVSMNEEQAKAAVKFYRDTYPEVPQAWYALESAMKQAVRERTDVIALDGRVAFSSDGDCLQMRLPSGRWLKYWQPLIETVETPWGERRPTLTYLGKQQMGGKVGRIATHGGKALEQATQATARDVLAEGLRRAEAAGYHVVLHAHDEIVAEVDTDHPELGVDHLAGVLCAPIPWAETMPLGAAGFEGAFYRKD